MIDTLKPLIKQFLPFAQERMGFDHPPRLFVRQDADNAANPLGKTAYYDPGASSVTLYVTDRHPKDVMRSLSHELVHHTQHCNGEFENAGEMGEGYAQNNPHMREMERQAYEVGNLCFRDWEDSIKGTIYNEHLQKGVEKNMSTKDWKDGELNSLLLEKWGFKFDLDRLNEGTPAVHEVPVDDDEPDLKPGKRFKRGLSEEEGEEELQEKAAFKKGEETEDDEKAFEDPSKGEKITTNGSKKRGSKKGDEAYVNEEEDIEEGKWGKRIGKGIGTAVGATKGAAVGAASPLPGGAAIGAGVGGVAGAEVGGAIGDKLTGNGDEEEEEEIEERRGRGRKGPQTRGTPDPRLRESEIRALVREALKIVMERKK